MAGELRRNGNQSTYGYTAGSNLIAGLTETTGSNFAQTRSYLANRNLLDIVETKVSTASKAKFDYDHDTLGRRKNVVQTGEIFSRYTSAALSTRFGYNDRSELISAQTYNGQNPADTTYPVAARNYAYAYDNIGNRTSFSLDGTAYPSTNNNLNQVTQTTRYPGMTVTGLAPASATVTVGGATATRQGEYFHHWVGAGSASTPVWWTLNIASSYGGAETRNFWLPASPQTYTYDLDGNLLTDDRWAYSWDAENRLKAMETRTDIISGALIPTDKARRIEFNYDYLGRRIEKIVKKDWNGSSFPTVESRQRFIYDGWNLIAEFSFDTSTSTLTLNRSYTWGLDLSGSTQGAGGVGGLLAIIHASGTVHLPAFDGNGNLLALVNRSTGTIEAAYEYSPFGELLRATGAYAKVNPFRFSTKYADDETQLVYYGFRYYDPKNGRFLGRDPIEEKGGLNLYAFVRNGPVNAWDFLGMYTEEDLLDPDWDYWKDSSWEVVNEDHFFKWGGGYTTSRHYVIHSVTGERYLSFTETQYYEDDPDDDGYYLDWNSWWTEMDEAMAQMDARAAWLEAKGVWDAKSSSGESLLSMIGRGIKNLFGGGGGNSGGSANSVGAPNSGGNRYDPATDRWIRPDGSSYRTSTSVGEAKVIEFDVPLPRPQYISSAPSPSFQDQFTSAQWAEGVVAAQEIQQRNANRTDPFTAIQNAGRETFGNAVFQQPLTTLATAGAQATVLVGAGYAGAAAYPVVAGGVEFFNALPLQGKAFIIGGVIRLTVGAGGEHTATNLAARRVLANTIAAETAAAAAKQAARGVGSPP